MKNKFPTSQMKKYLFYVLLAISLAGCREQEVATNEFIIIQIEHHAVEPKGMILYWTESTDERAGIRTFFDTIGKFNIGDTVIIGKNCR